MNGLDFTKLEVSFSKGLNQKTDPRLVQAPDLVRAVDVEFDDAGGLRLRYPYASIGSNILGGGTISDCRRLYAVGDELILFTKDSLYSWSPQRSAWVSKGTHLAVSTEEKSVFVSTGDQNECDRAQLNGVVMYCWSEVVNGGNQVIYAMVDATTGAVLSVPQSAGNGQRCKLLALTSVFLLLYENLSGGLLATTLSPTTLAITNAVELLAAGSFNSYFDAEKIPEEDTAIIAARRDVTTSYELIKVAADLTMVTATKARQCTGPIAVACPPVGNYVQVLRTIGTSVIGDLIDLDPPLSDVHTNQAIGTGSMATYQLTGAFVDSTTCHVFWHSNESTLSSVYTLGKNTVTIANTVGGESALVLRLGVASRAFTYNGHAYVWAVFAGTSGFTGANAPSWFAQLQNSLFLYRSDGHLVTKAAWQRAGGLLTTGHLPSVVLTSGATTFSFATCERRVVPIGDGDIGQTTYSDRGPRDVSFTFDANAARRVARCGLTTYVTGGLVLQYDGRDLVEAGFQVYPWWFACNESLTGNIPDGEYALKLSWRFDNAKGERERSTSATTRLLTISSGPSGIDIPTTAFPPLHVTRKSGVAVEVWRTPVAAATDSPFYLTTSNDPTATTNPNRYVPNDITGTNLPAFEDEFADATLTTKETHPENGAVLENLAPPSATLIAASSDRVFLAGIAGAPDQVCYSKLRGEGELAAFHDALTVQVPERGGVITGLAFLNETLVVFRETAIYALDGRGFSNTGEDQNYDVRLVSSDLGAANQESIVLAPMGLVFKSSKGWHLLNRGWATDYIGAAVKDYDGETVHSAHVVETQHQVRIVTASRALCWDYLANAWAEWSIADGLHACIYGGAHHVLATGAVRAQSTSYATADYGWDVEMLVHLGGLQGFARVRRIQLLGEVRGAGSVRFRVGTYREGVYFDDKTWTISPTTVGAELSVLHGPSQQQHKAVRVRLTSHTSAGEKPKLSALSLEVGMKPGLFRHLSAAQRQ